jgi:hypothetical protein
MSIATTAPAQRHHELLCATQATALGDQAPVPGQQRAWSHDPVQPQVPGQHPSQGRDHGAVRPVRLGAGDLAAQDGDLMPQDQDLRVLSSLTSRQERQPVEHPDHEQVGKTDEHERRA